MIKVNKMELVQKEKKKVHYADEFDDGIDVFNDVQLQELNVFDNQLQ